MSVKHVVLAPKNDYYNWIKSIRLYLLTFDPKLTNEPENALSYDVVTIINPSGSFSEEPDISSWLLAKNPNIQIDNMPVQTQEELAQAMHARVLANQRYGEKTEQILEAEEEIVVEAKSVVIETEFKLSWPTEFPIVVQEFGGNSEMFSRWGLPGHEGVDIRALPDTKIFASAAGKVYRIERDPSSTAYGKQIRIYHPEGFRTVYANLDQILVVVGQEVEKGDVIASAGGSDNSENSQIHFSLKRDFASENQITCFSGDFVDPLPYLEKPSDVELPGSEKLLEQKRMKFGWNRPCLVGLNMQETGRLDDADLQAINTGRVEAIKVTSHTSGDSIDRLINNKTDIFIMCQLLVPDSRSFYSTSEWLELALPFAQMMYSRNVRYFEVHKLPNLNEFGFGKYWQSGNDFSNWWKTVVGQLKEKMPDAKFGFPALSPGGQVNGLRGDAKIFLEQADSVIQTADWLGVSCYWTKTTEANHSDNICYFETARNYFPKKLLFVSEFANIDPYSDDMQTGDQYSSYYQKMRRVAGVGAVFAESVYSEKGLKGMNWRSKEGKISDIAKQVGKRGF